MKCECCGDRSERKSKYCSFCDKLYFKEEKLRVREKKPVVKKERVPLGIKACECCKKEYKQKVYSQKFCSDECRPKVMSEFEKWVNVKPRAKNMDSNQVAYGFFRKKYGTSKKLNVCRG